MFTIAKRLSRDSELLDWFSVLNKDTNGGYYQHTPAFVKHVLLKAG